MLISPEVSNLKTMKAAQGKDYGDIDEMISVEEGVPYPSLKDLPKKKRKNLLVIKTHAVALACGDCRVLSGLTKKFQGPPSFPYIPGGDASGIVVEIPEGVENFPFKIGDRVAARFNGVPRDALAEYALIHKDVCEIVPENVSSEDAVALASACPATLLAERIQEGERVLILGAGGGVGSHTVQLMRARGASFIAGCSRTPERLLEPPLNYDRAIDYTKEDVFSIEEFKENPFDVVLDLSSGNWLKIVEGIASGEKSIVKPSSLGGRFLTITPDTAHFGGSVSNLMKCFLWVPLWRVAKSRVWSRRNLPKYTFAMSLPGERSVMTKTMDFAQKGTLKAAIDPKGPFPFTTEGVRKAFRLQESRHIQGKVVIQVSQ